ncbi:zinc transporter ZntB [Marimonas sp. MJW-29]|uniref:Zinc transporter ZntB n=1 Tax=Sulfitobacter sediminis TaxID=3234186 RepID=A0ABV3RHV3_9RHOB
MAICVFDILPDGTITVPSDTGLTGKGTYRWWHFDLSEAGLSDWINANLPPIPGGSLLQPETRPRCDRFEEGLILNLRGINLNEGQDADHMVSVRMWVEDNLVITVRLRKLFALEDIRQDMIAGKGPATTAAFVELLVGKLTARVQEEVARISELTEFYEDDLEDDSTPIPTELSVTRRQVIRLRRYLDPQRVALTKLAAVDLPIIPEPDGLKLRELANRTTLAVEELDSMRERLVTVQDEHDLHVACSQARHSFILSLAAAVFLPLSFLTGLFGVNIAGMPGMENPAAFTILCLGMAVLALLLLLLFRLRRWL